MTILLIIAAIVFVLSVAGIHYVWTSPFAPDAGPPLSILFAICVVAFVVSLILFGVVVGMTIGA